MEMATKPQISKLHVLFKDLQLTDDRKGIISELTGGRTESTKELTIREACNLIKHLCDYLPCEKLKSAIRLIAYRAGVIYGNSETDKILNKVKLDVFLRERGAVKKDLEKQTYEELIRTHRQFEGMVKNNAKSKENKAAGKAVKELLSGLEVSLIK